jgi:pimeloyl-ACP methyl ester carboxylesterase
VDERKDVVVVAHSYGGVVASAAVNGLDKIARGAANKPCGVVKVVFLSAFALDKGQSLLGILGGNFLPWMRVEVCIIAPHTELDLYTAITCAFKIFTQFIFIQQS